MSRVLRRPMFRGGIADSEGVGITSGLDTPKRGLVDGPGGYAGDLDEILKQQLSEIESRRNYTPPKTSEEIKKEYLSKEEATFFDPDTGMGVGIPGSYAQNQLDYIQAISSPTYKSAYLAKREKEEAVKRKIGEQLGYKFDPTLYGKNITNKDKDDLKTDDNIQGTKKDLTSFFDEYMTMINKANLVDQDQLTKQKYLELAKFGFNLGKPTPAGIKPNLLNSIATAAEKPLEEYGNILTRESQMKQLPKQLALQAAINAMAPGQLEKNIQGLVKAGLSPKKALEFVTKEGTYQQRIQDREEQNFYSPMLEAQFKLKKPSLQQTASKSFVDWLKIDSNLNIGQISLIPADRGLAIDKKYYIDPSTGVIVKFDKKIKDYREAGEI